MHKNQRTVAVIVEVAVPVVARYSQTKSTGQSRYPAEVVGAMWPLEMKCLVLHVYEKVGVVS